PDFNIKEFNRVSEAFNRMAVKIEHRNKSLKTANNKLSAMNKTYLDLIGFVSHELNNILSSTTLNAYMVRDGYLGMINFKQRKALDSVTNNLDYFTSTVKNFLNLSRIEKNELRIRKEDLLLREDIFDNAVDSYRREIENKEMKLINRIKPGQHVIADKDLLQIVASNLLSNAIKYGKTHGRILLDAETNHKNISVTVYNDGEPIRDEDKAGLFRKFSRLKQASQEKIKGTGLGLFITKEIITNHNGTITMYSEKEGNSFIFTLNKE
ncbi:MAG: HAMP domain-containing histidine kinase, partial [Spirochaetes bacterium]|nr:HAMP domain-containing histidine kinase [Spirochaetota bacterium]